MPALSLAFPGTSIDPNDVMGPDRLDKRRLARAFERAAAGYEGQAVLQRTVAERMIERLSLTKLVPRWVLDGGAGTGYGGRLLDERYRLRGLVALDLAWGMLREARRHGPRLLSCWRYVCGDLERLPLRPASFDLVFCNLSFQWCNDLELALDEIKRVLVPNGLLMFSTLGPDTLWELRASWAAADRFIHVHGFLDMHDVGDAVIRAGFGGPVLDVERFSLTYSDALGVMRDLKLLGAANVAQDRRRGLTGKGLLERVRNAYESYRFEGRLPATYEVVYGHAWAPGPGDRPQDGSTVASFPIDALRGSWKRGAG